MSAHIGKSLPEALILASINLKYELQVQYKKNTSSVHVVYSIVLNDKTKNQTIDQHQHVLNLLVFLK